MFRRVSAALFVQKHPAAQASRATALRAVNSLYDQLLEDSDSDGGRDVESGRMPSPLYRGSINAGTMDVLSPLRSVPHDVVPRRRSTRESGIPEIPSAVSRRDLLTARSTSWLRQGSATARPAPSPEKLAAMEPLFFTARLFGVYAPPVGSTTWSPLLGVYCTGVLLLVSIFFLLDLVSIPTRIGPMHILLAANDPHDMTADQRLHVLSVNAVPIISNVFASRLAFSVLSGLWAQLCEEVDADRIRRVAKWCSAVSVTLSVLFVSAAQGAQRQGSTCGGD